MLGIISKENIRFFPNDLYFSYANAKAVIENNEELKFKGLKAIGIESVLDFLSKGAKGITLNQEVVGY